jgi:hypothetical protein
MGPHNRRGHTSSSSSSSSFSSKRTSGITSPVLANSSFLSLDYFAPPNSPASTSTAPAVLKNTTHSRLVTVATFTDSPIMSFPEVHPFIYTSPNTPESSTMKSPDSPSGSSISGSDYHGIGLAAMTASPGSGSSTSASPSPDEPRVLGSPDSDATVVKIETGSNETPMADGSKSRLAVQLATVQFPQPKIINYARPFRVSQQQQEVPSLPSLTSSSPCAVSTDQPPTPDFGAAPVTEEPFQLITPDSESKLRVVAYFIADQSSGPPWLVDTETETSSSQNCITITYQHGLFRRAHYTTRDSRTRAECRCRPRRAYLDRRYSRDGG